MQIMSDIHGNTEPIYNFCYGSNEKYCIQLGDFGLIFNEKETEEEKAQLNLINSWLLYNNKFFFTILGNHECWPRYFQMTVVEMFGAKCWKIRDHMYAVCPGEILEIEDKTYLCIGGADSIDKDWRETQFMRFGTRLWWKEEAITEDDIVNAKKNLAKYDNKVSYVLTHTPPFFFTYKLYSSTYSSKSEDLLDEIMNIVDYDAWYCGHVHLNAIVSTGNKSVSSLGIDEIGYLI